MKTVLVKKSGKQGGVLGFNKIVLLNSFMSLTGPVGEKQYRTYFLAECDGELCSIAAEDLNESYEDYCWDEL